MITRLRVASNRSTQLADRLAPARALARSLGLCPHMKSPRLCRGIITMRASGGLSGGFFSPRTPEPGSTGPWTRPGDKEHLKNRQYAPEAFQDDKRAPGQKKRLGISEKTSELVFREIPSFFLCACAQAGRQSRPAWERRVFVLIAAAVHCLKNKSYTIRNGWGPGRIILPDGARGSAPAFPLHLRYAAGKRGRSASAAGGVRGGTPSPTGPGAAPRRSLPAAKK